MIKSLYFRVALVFIGIVIVSLIAALSVSTTIYTKQIKGSIENEIIAYGGKVIRMLQSSPKGEAEEYMKQAANLSNLNIGIFDASKQLIYQNKNIGNIDASRLQPVLNGGVYRGTVHVNESGREEEHLLIGLPFQIDSRSYALFLSPRFQELIKTFQEVTRTLLIIALVIGSVLILIAARYIVRPLRVLTEGTRKVAAGNFNITIHSKSKDEVGQLTSSFNDMTKQLATLDQMRSEFVNNVSHEIQSPLMSISGFTKALKSKKLNEEQRMHYLTIIEEESERLSRMGQNLLRLSSLQSEHPAVVLRKFRLDEQLRSTVIASEPQWKAKSLEIELELEEEVIIEADEDLLNQVWTNLLNNAVKFTPEGGHIQIFLQRSGQWAIIRIADSGIGIAEEERKFIFVPFHKTDKSRDTAVKGNGLGLSIVKRIVDLHHGDITVGGALDEGTVMTVKLPLSFDQL